MPTLLKKILPEFLWLALALVATLLIIYFFLDWEPGRRSVDIQFYDTYVVITVWLVITTLFVLLVFLFFFIKETRKRLYRSFPNLIITLSGLLLIALLAKINKDFLKLAMESGWLAHPMPAGSSRVHEPYYFVDYVTNSLTVIQLSVTLALLLVMFQWGRGSVKTIQY